MVDIRARGVRRDNKSYTGKSDGRVIDDTVTLLGDREWAIKALMHATRSNLESFFRAKESGHYNAAVSSLELACQSILKLSELYRHIRVERVDEAQGAADSESALPLAAMLTFMAQLRVLFTELYPDVQPEPMNKRVKSRDEREGG